MCRYRYGGERSLCKTVNAVVLIQVHIDEEVYKQKLNKPGHVEMYVN